MIIYLFNYNIQISVKTVIEPKFENFEKRNFKHSFKI